MENFFKRMFGAKKKGFMFTTRNLATHTGNGERISSQRESSTGSTGFTTVESLVSDSSDYIRYSTSSGSIGGIMSTASQTAKEAKVDERKEVEPKAVFEEVKREGLEPDFTNLDTKIKAVEGRISILKEHLSDDHLRDEHKALFFLKNRRKYLDTRKKTPLDWAMTNREAVDDLCKRYKLQTVPLKQYYTLVPNEGLKEMARFTKAYKAITGDLPIFELVIKDAEKKPEEAAARKKKDRDPILLANSPLGDFMFVIGAWDEEVEFVDEIIYQGK